MTFQEIVRELASRCSITGAQSIVVGSAAGEHARAVRWAKDAWRAIQLEHEWGFLRKDMSFLTIAGQAAYLRSSMQAVNAPIRMIDAESLRIQRESIGTSDQQFLVEWDYESWRDTYGYNVQVNGRPAVFAVRPDDRALVLGSVPDDVYRITGVYWRQAQELSAAEDVPIVDDEFHMAIVFKAMLTYANTEAAAESKMEAQERLDEIMPAMRRVYLPAGGWGGPLA